MGKLSFVMGFAAGYVVGTRAGRDRYEQITALAQRAANSAAARSAKESISAQAGEVLDTARRKAHETIGGRADAAEGARPGAGASPAPGQDGRQPVGPYPGAGGPAR